MCECVCACRGISGGDSGSSRSFRIKVGSCRVGGGKVKWDFVEPGPARITTAEGRCRGKFCWSRIDPSWPRGAVAVKFRWRKRAKITEIFPCAKACLGVTPREKWFPLGCVCGGRKSIPWQVFRPDLGGVPPRQGKSNKGAQNIATEETKRKKKRFCISFGEKKVYVKIEGKQ